MKLRRILAALAAPALIAGAAMAMSAGPALAAPGNGSGAVVITGSGCTVFDGNGALVFDPAATFHVVQTPSGNIQTYCSGSVTPSSTGHAVVYNNLGCATFGGSTTDARETVSASGAYNLNCNINPSS
jgi:hypothetical protein